MHGFFWKKFRDNVIVDDLCQETFIRSAADKNNLFFQFQAKNFNMVMAAVQICPVLNR